MDDLSSLVSPIDPEDDYTHFSDSLIYTPVNIPGAGCNQSDFECQLSGCTCENNSCLNRSCDCISRLGPNYSEELLLLSVKFFNSSVIECNDLCLCDGSCVNRVVQKGPRRGLEIFDCGTSKGLGLKTALNIPEGGFICEYAGEVIGKAQAMKRFQSAVLKGDMNYIFILRENTSSNVIETIVDPTVIGNIGRYINHSCSPNCAIVPVRVNCAVPKLAIFAVRNIEAGEEITFDYSGGKTSNMPPESNRKNCFCGSPTCFKFLPFDQSLC